MEADVFYQQPHLLVFLYTPCGTAHKQLERAAVHGIFPTF